MARIRISEWRKYFRHQQKPGWCGPAVIQMVLAAGGVRRTQSRIARDVYKPWWGTNQQMIFSYLSQFFKESGFKQKATLRDVNFYLKQGYVVIVNWFDDVDSKEQADGHYSLVVGYSQKRGMVKLADPAANRGIWEMSVKDFNDRWYDFLDLHGNHWVEGWMLWVNPKSRIEKSG